MTEEVKAKISECYNKIKDLDSEALARFFAEKGIKGKSGDGKSCPVRNFIAQCAEVDNIHVGSWEIHLTVSRPCACGDTACRETDDLEPILELSESTKEFISRFDKGWYLGLRETES